MDVKLTWNLRWLLSLQRSTSISIFDLTCVDGNKGSGPSLGAVFGTAIEGIFGGVNLFPDCVCVKDHAPQTNYNGFFGASLHLKGDIGPKLEAPSIYLHQVYFET